MASDKDQLIKYVKMMWQNQIILTSKYKVKSTSPFNKRENNSKELETISSQIKTNNLLLEKINSKKLTDKELIFVKKINRNLREEHSFAVSAGVMPNVDFDEMYKPDLGWDLFFENLDNSFNKNHDDRTLFFADLNNTKNINYDDSVLFKKKSTRISIALSVAWLVVAIIYSEISRDYRAFFDITWGVINSREEETLWLIFLPIVFILSYPIWKNIYLIIIQWINQGK